MPVGVPADVPMVEKLRPRAELQHQRSERLDLKGVLSVTVDSNCFCLLLATVLRTEGTQKPTLKQEHERSTRRTWKAFD